MGKDDKCKENSCELCSIINVNPVDVKRNGDRLLTVIIEVSNVIYDKKVAIDCIIYDQYHKIIDYSGFITIVLKDYGCNKNGHFKNKYGTIERKIVFVLSDVEMCDFFKLEVHAGANYI